MNTTRNVCAYARAYVRAYVHTVHTDVRNLHAQRMCVRTRVICVRTYVRT